MKLRSLAGRPESALSCSWAKHGGTANGTIYESSFCCPLAPSAASSVDAAPPVAASGVENIPDPLSEPMATDPSPPSVLAPAPATTTTAIAPSSEKTRLATLIPNPQARQAVASIIYCC